MDNDIKVLPVSARPIPNPFLGVRDSMIAPLRFEREDSDIIQYFLSPRQAATAIKQGTLWPGHSVSADRISNLSRKFETEPFSVKGFIVCNVTRDAFAMWYSTATIQQQLMAVPPVETRRKSST